MGWDLAPTTTPPHTTQRHPRRPAHQRDKRRDHSAHKHGRQHDARRAAALHAAPGQAPAVPAARPLVLRAFQVAICGPRHRSLARPFQPERHDGGPRYPTWNAAVYLAGTLALLEVLGKLPRPTMADLPAKAAARCAAAHSLPCSACTATLLCPAAHHSPAPHECRLWQVDLHSAPEDAKRSHHLPHARNATPGGGQYHRVMDRCGKNIHLAGGEGGRRARAVHASTSFSSASCACGAKEMRLGIGGWERADFQLDDC